ncbi:nitrite reductase large subunit NirB [Aliikangiella sp. G2MR2-5]|uniref:nitrite reductase large subunit NirB n=1 Tax=Aliikangiella sp. G2MR2-5 TaxID=2788943 RepID=UPI0018A931E0|nr:nitrite reductase large subunit NirB [Aliikangiella sp. G2MR2-5]
MKHYDFIIVGNGMVGNKFIDYAIKYRHKEEVGKQSKALSFLVLSEESKLAYDRVQLSSYFSNKSAQDLSLASEEEYRKNNIDFVTNCKVLSIHRDDKLISTQCGQQFTYHKLILATGSFPFIPAIKGSKGESIHVYRTLDDLDAIKQSACAASTGVVIGGGLLGLEAANALNNLNLKTTVVEFAPRLMPVQLDKNGSKLLKQKIESLGLSVLLEKNTKEIISGEQSRYRLNFTDGSHLETDMIIFSAGIRPQDKLAASSGLATGERGGIMIDSYCLTSDKSIYAIGECASWQGSTFGLVAPGYQMAKVAFTHAINTLKENIGKTKSSQEEPLEFCGSDMSTKLKLLGVDVASIGDAHGQTENCLCYCFSDETDGIYKKLVISADAKHLIGAVLVGCTKDYGQWLQLYLNQIELPASPERLLFPEFDESSETNASGVHSLPDNAQICSCNDVTKKQIHGCIQSGVHELSVIKQETNAGTGCGGCTQLIGQILTCELEKIGVAVNNHICEHFDYSRQELFDIVKTTRIKTFAQLISDYGHGNGCELCKPVIASILASLWNEPILDKPHLGLQDTNDAFLANMQKDGTYSVVPRIPGGEITPDKLIVIGQVAKDFGLYTKITGGQRIDLFGAQLHELPQIWKRLIDAGFETGHAYGKALRTVKSCVGSTWCRFGVQDSTGMAIYLEQRYRGVRSPHKIKMAVSGCARECAEAQSKDFGVIATEKGWNLYVGGNGGMRPRHADLFATDLNDKTLIQYIDRIMVFYIRTAERLQRTSVWLESLEGGLDYLKEVVIKDKLQLNAEMEDQMKHLVNSYQCEWKNTLQDTKKLKRFNHFINSRAPDPEVVFVDERGQKRPADEKEKAAIKNAATSHLLTTA